MIESYSEKIGGGMDAVSKEAARVRGEVRDRVATYIIGGLGVVVGLSWNEAIKSIIDYVYPAASGGSIYAKVLYAVILTLVVVLVTIYVVRPQEKKD